MRIVLLVIDSGGIGTAPDSEAFGDGGANTIGHTAQAVPSLSLPHLAAMGLSALVTLPGTPAVPLQGVAYPVYPKAAGKDTLAGHWEMMGLTVTIPFRTFPHGFDAAIIDKLSSAFGRPVLGNEVASGTEIIARLGEQHMANGWPIVYTSADSVLQIAAHEDIVPLSQLYTWCQSARDIMQGPWLVGRIIARPFIGIPGQFVRTAHRHDFSVSPTSATQVDALQEAGVRTIAVGKIGDIFSGRGFDVKVPTISNQDGLEKTAAALAEWPDRQSGFIFTNLVEFDSHYGHRRDVAGYAQALKELDNFLPKLWALLEPGDQLWITADHGCDPTYRGTDHTREALPWLCYGPSLTPYVGSPRMTLGDIGATLAALFATPQIGQGKPSSELITS
ncbi:phosphopentomutase [Sulfobacillus sp. hq2]|uniref:phosphopentomutase n=1 Tax=Sulfobacillus TaxID=28033 RepID=UPI000CD18897|nr:phosphopentomutase [Sulfobacillus sp. hq2]POB11371.1 phosphopentomutase [Sulfobacillus sp. hq2]